MTYKRHQEITKNPFAAPIFDKTRVDYRNDPLRGYNVWPCGVKPNPPVECILKDKTTRSAVEELLTEIKYNFVVHVLYNSAYEPGTESNQRAIETAMLADPLGLTEIPKENTDFWTVRRIGVPVEAATGSNPEPVNISEKTDQSSTEQSESDDSDLAGEGTKHVDSGPAQKESEDPVASASQKPTDGKTGKETAIAELSTATKDDSEKQPADAGKKSRKSAKKRKRKAKFKVKRKKDTSGKKAAMADTPGASRVIKVNKRTAPSSAKRVTTMVKADLYLQYDVLTEEYYKYLRASIGKYMDQDAKDTLNNLIAHEEEKREIPFKTRADPGIRLPWAWIEATIHCKLCTQTLGNYYFRSLLTMQRKPGETRSQWCQRVTSAQKNIAEYGNGWEMIGCKDAVNKLHSFLSKEERKTVWEHYRDRKPHQGAQYHSQDDMLWKEPLADLVKVITMKITDDRWESESYDPTLTPGWNALLHEHSEFHSLQAKFNKTKATANKREELLKELKAKVKKDKKRLTKREAKRLRAQAKSELNTSAQDENQSDGEEFAPEDDPPMEDKPKSQRKGKPCLSCLDLGLGYVYHDKCDKKKQKLALVAMMNKKVKTIDYFIGQAAKHRRKSRKNSIDDYSFDHCRLCMALDVPPKFSKYHKASKCVYRENGPVHKELGTSYKQMVVHTKMKVLEAARKKVWPSVLAERKGAKPKAKTRVVRNITRASSEDEEGTDATASVKTPKRKVNKLLPTFFEIQYEAAKQFTVEEANDKAILTSIRRYLVESTDTLKSVRSEIANKVLPMLISEVKATKWVKLPQTYVPPPKRRKITLPDKPEAPKPLPYKIPNYGAEFVRQFCTGTLSDTHKDRLEDMLIIENTEVARFNDIIKQPFAAGLGVDPSSPESIEDYMRTVLRKPRMMGVTDEMVRMVKSRLSINQFRNDLETLYLLDGPLTDEDISLYKETCKGGSLYDKIFDRYEDKSRVQEARITLLRIVQAKGKVANRKGRMATVAQQKREGTYVPKPKAGKRRRAKPGTQNVTFYAKGTGDAKTVPRLKPSSAMAPIASPPKRGIPMKGTNPLKSALKKLVGENTDESESEPEAEEGSSSDSDITVCAHAMTDSNCHTNAVNCSSCPVFDIENQSRETGLSQDGSTFRLRHKGQATTFELPIDNYIPASRLRVSLPVARTDFEYAKLKKSDASINGQPRKYLSETKGHRLLQCFMDYVDSKGEIRTGRIQLDTQANVNYCKPGIGKTRDWKPWETKHAVGATNTKFELGRPTAFKAMRNGTPVIIDTNDPPAGCLSGDCVALLGFEAIQMLGIDLNYHIRFNTHKRVKFLDDLTEAKELCEKTINENLEEYAELIDLSKMVKVVHLSERVIQEYLETHKGEYEKHPIDIEAVDINPELSLEQKKNIIKLIKEFRDVFAKFTNTLPPPMNKVKPHKFKLKPGAEPTTVPPPKFGPAKAKLIMEWMEWAQEAGLIERAPGSAYAARLHLAAKYNSDTPKSSPPDGIRITWAGVKANDTLLKSVATYTNAWEQMYKVANHKYKFSADGLKQYWSIPLDEDSRDLTTFWTPDGLWRFKRLVMGTKNAATVAQNAYTHALHTDLPAQFRGNIANFADDFLGGADTIDGPTGLISVFRGFLEMAREAGITLNPKKVRIGYEAETFFGLTIDKGKISHAKRNLDPIVKMVNPENRSELRSVMGVFNQFKVFCKDYGRSQPVRTLNALNSTKVPFIWTDEHTKALEEIRETILEGVHLWAPRNDLPLHMDTDGSDDGWGAVLYQIVEGERKVIKMWSKKWDTEAWRKKPPYHREAKAWMNGMELALPYTLCNQHPIECYTDHSPLTWVKHTSGKGPVSQFIIDKLSLVDYNMHYVKGENNEIADALSRFPLLGPQTLTRVGIKNSLHMLLAALIDTDVDLSKLWFDVRKDTKHLIADVTEWRDSMQVSAKGKSIRMNHMSESNIKKLPYTFGIWAPDADKVTHQCSEAFKKGTPFACLIPSDLVGYIAQEPDGTYNEAVAELVKQSGKISFLDTQLAWIIHKAPQVSKIYRVKRSDPNLVLEVVPEGPIRAVFNNERSLSELQSEEFMENPSKRVTAEPNLDQVKAFLKDTNLTPPLRQCPNRQQWIRLQQQHRIPQIWKGRSTNTADGLCCYQESEDRPLRTIVPKPLQAPLVRWKHMNMCHMGFKKVYHELSKRFYWEKMHSMCKHIVKACALCASLKAKMRLAHKHFRAKLFSKPRTSYGSDYYGVKKNKLGYCAILGIIDLASGDLVLKATTSPNAAHVTNTLFHEVILKKGVPLRFHSDAAQAFLSKAMGALTEVLGIKQTSTLAHNPKSNAKMERAWEFVGRALKSMTKEQYEQFHLYLPILEHVWNNTPDSDSGHTPFEIEHGMPMRGVAESLTEDPPDEGLPADANDFKAIAASAYAFAENLQQIKAIEKVRAAERLNERGFAIKRYHLHDRVTFYLPPSKEQAQSLSKNPKHCLQYAGPAVITESLSDNGTAWKLRWNGRTYMRNIMHMQPYVPDAHVLHEQRAVQDNTVQVGSYVAVLDSGEDDHYHMALVTDLTDQVTTLRYLGTGSNELRSAVWQWAYHSANHFVMKTQDEPNKQLVGSINTQPIGESLIILPNVGLDEHMRLTKDSREILRGFPEKHHVHGVTWDRSKKKNKRKRKRRTR